jgi:D-aminopeptidase
MIVATDAPLLDYQLNRLARRAGHGLAKTGSISGNSSGDFTLAFSTANPIPRRDFWRGTTYAQGTIDQSDIYLILEAASEATEEAIVNALFMATDMEGRDGSKVFALPLARTLEIMRRHRRLFAPADREGNDG